MSSYLYTKNGEITFNSEFADEMLAAIKKEANNKSWDNYGWVNEIRNAESLEDVLKEFEIDVKDIGNGWVSCTVNDAYNSSFLKTMLECTAEYLEDSEMQISNSDYDDILIVRIKNGNVTTEGTSK